MWLAHMCVSYVNAQRPDGNREANDMPPHLGQTPRLVSIEIENVTGTSSAWARRRCRYRCKCTIKNNCTMPAYVLTNPNTTSNTLHHLHHHHNYFNKIRSTFRKEKKKQYSVFKIESRNGWWSQINPHTRIEKHAKATRALSSLYLGELKWSAG